MTELSRYIPTENSGGTVGAFDHERHRRRRVPFYLSQDLIDRLAHLLWQHQTVTDIIGRTPEPSIEAACFLTELRKQCCLRSGAADPFEDLPLYPSFPNATPRALEGR